jgi:hypothetical protein
MTWANLPLFDSPCGLFRTSFGPDLVPMILGNLQRQTRLDLLFKPVNAMKTRIAYDGLTLRCATNEEHERILR